MKKKKKPVQTVCTALAMMTSEQYLKEEKLRTQTVYEVKAAAHGNNIQTCQSSQEMRRGRTVPEMRQI